MPVATMVNGETRVIAQRTETTSAPSPLLWVNIRRASWRFLVIDRRPGVNQPKRCSSEMEPLLETCCIPAMNCLPPGVHVVIGNYGFTLRYLGPLSSGGTDDNQQFHHPLAPPSSKHYRAVTADDLEERALDIVWRRSLSGRRRQWNLLCRPS